MTSPDRVTCPSPELRTTVYYFVQFMSAGAANAFSGIWFASRGLSPEEIGIISAVPVFVLLMINLFVGRLADRATDWRQVIVIGALASGLFPFGLFFAGGFWGILLFWSLAATAQSAVVPVADAAAMRITRRRGTDYGTIRAWGTIGYLTVTSTTGYLILWFGAAIFLPLFAGLSLLRGLMSLTLPTFRAPPGSGAASGATRLLHVMKPWFVLPLVGWSMVYATHLILNAFQGLLWQEQGIPAGTIGLLIAAGALSEAAMFFAFRRFGGRIPARSLILLSSVVSVLRWVAMAVSPGVELLFGLQLLHAVTYALGFLGCVNFIANWTSEDIAAEAQSFFVVIQQAFAILTFTAFGWLAGAFGAKAYLASAAFAAAGAALVFASMRMQPAKAAGGP